MVHADLWMLKAALDESRQDRSLDQQAAAG
jgi:hypothetical protein